MTLDQLDQWVILTLGPLAVFLSQTRALRVRRWGCVVAMISQPFWYHTAITHGQWGLFGASLVYTLVWVTGFWTLWLKPQEA